MRRKVLNSVLITMALTAAVTLTPTLQAQTPTKPRVIKGPTQKLTALPDLTITHLELSTTGTIAVTIRNDCVGASAPTTVRFYVYKTIDESSGILRTTHADVPAIQPDATVVVNLSTGEKGEISTITVGHFLKVTVDPDNKIAESAEGNNSATIKGNYTSYPFPLKCGHK